jgi:hypothetical protein
MRAKDRAGCWSFKQQAYLFSFPLQHVLVKSGLVAEPKPRVRRSEQLPKPRQVQAGDLWARLPIVTMI